VNLTTNAARAGTDCKLSKGDHPFIAQDSYISYGDALEITPTKAKNLEELIEKKFIHTHAPIEEKYVTKICAAAMTSKAFQVRLRRYL